MKKRLLAYVTAITILLTMMGGCKKNTESNVSESSFGSSDISSSDINSDINSDDSGNNSSVSSENPQDTSQSGETQSSAGKTSKTIVVWNVSDSVFLKSAVDYQNKNKDITVKIETPASITPSTLKVAIAAGNAPDVVRMDHVYATSMGLSGNIADLSEYGAKNIKSKFTESCWNAVSSGSNVYGIPFDANTIAFMYNKTLLNKANRQAPGTYDEMLDVCNAIKSTSSGVWGYTAPFGSSDKNWAAFQYFFWLWRMGGDILSSDNKTPAFNSQAGVQALQMLVDMSKNGLADKTYREAEFYQGTVGMIDMGCWSLSKTVFKDPNTYAVTMMPVLKQGIPGYSGLGLYCYSVVSTSKIKQEAFDYISYLCTNDDYQIKYCSSKYNLPSLISAQSNSYYTSGKNAETWKVYFEQLKLSKARPPVENWNDVEKTIADAVLLAVNGTATPKEALDAAANTVKRILK